MPERLRINQSIRPQICVSGNVSAFDISPFRRMIKTPISCVPGAAIEDFDTSTRNVGGRLGLVEEALTEVAVFFDVS